MELRDLAIGLQERLLGQIVGQGVVALGQPPQEAAHLGLMLAHQSAERRGVSARGAALRRSGVIHYFSGAWRSR